MRKLILIIILIPVFLLQAQEKKIVQFTGYIRSDSLKGLPFVHIWNKNDGRGTLSNTNGYFTFVVQESDTICFSNIGYKKKFIIIPDGLPDYDFSAVIILQTDTIMLTEATILPWATYENFKEAVIRLELPDDDLIRAQKNLDLAVAEAKDFIHGTVYPGVAYKQKMYYEHYNKLYSKGQLPPNNLLNPIAWVQFFEALQRGDLKIMKP